MASQWGAAMIGDGWPPLSRGRAVLLVLALIGLGYLFLQTRGTPARLSDWNANRTFAAASAPLTNDAAQPLAGEAQVGRGAPAEDDVPAGDPLQSARTVMTQGYGVGSHAPANIWGAVDLAIDGDSDGQADPQGSLGAPVYATQRGVVHLARDTWPAGNHIWVEGIHFKTGYSHLKDFAPDLQEGQQVERGQLIGYVGSTGESSGPHLDYQVWKDGVNVNPLEYGALDGAQR
jgi:murein DD-endopeptidase MepM/ murein hydrolase activator NlpD